MHSEIKVFTDTFFRFFQPVIAATATASNAKALMLNLGYVPPEQFRVFDNLRARVNSIRDVIEAMAELSEEDLEADPQLLLDTIKNGVESISGLINDIQNLPTIVQSELNGSDLLAQTDILERLPLKLYDYLTIRYLKEHHNRIYSALKLFGIIEIKEIQEASNPFYFPRLERTFHWDKLAELLTSPMQLLKASLKDNRGYFYEKTMLIIQEAGLSLGLMPHYKFPVPDVLKFINNDPLIDTWPGFDTLEILRFPLVPKKVNGLGLDIYPLINTTDNTIKGLVMVLRVDPGETLFVINDNLKLGIELSGVANGLGIVLDENDEFRFVADLFASPQNLPDNVQFDFGARLTRNDEAVGDNTEKLFQLGTTDGNRFEVGSYNVTFGVAKQQNTRLYLEAELLDCFIRMKFDGADGFISKVIGDGIESNFSFGIGFSNDQGFYFAGSSGLEIELPTHTTLGPLQIQSLSVGITSTEEKILVTLASSVQVNMGPVTLLVRNIGVSFSGKSDNAVFVPNLTFKPPTGVGLSIDEAVVTGGGFLRFDPEKEQYDGIVELNLEGGIVVKGMGLIATRLPNNVKGFSLLIIITAEDFEPIPLPLGFRLIGIGGLLAINRSFDENVLRAGLKNHTLDSVLFPQDPIRNAPQILSNLNTVFPPANGHHLFGPMAQIEWGAPTLITADLAVVLELGVRQRLLVLAQIVAILPKPENDLIRLQMDGVGLVDFDQGTAALDAILYDSRLLKKFVLTGDMAMRLKLEGSPNFALAVGGFHPAYNPPPNFPKLERIALNLSTGDNPRLRCEAYYALTANTVQFGARAELYAKAAGFSIQGEVGFDVLIQPVPFHFLADFLAQVQLKRGSTNLFKVRVEGALDGPLPLHIKAKAKFEILWWDYSIRIDHTFIKGELPPLPTPIDVLSLLKEALDQPGNWTSQLPAGQRPMVTLRGKPGNESDVLLHPLGILTVKQGIVPLDMDISRFGHTLPAGARRFTINRVSLGDQSAAKESVTDFFAPAQFFEMSDDEKLSRPSFEPMAAGVSIGSSIFVFPENHKDFLTVDAIEFETKIIEKGKKEPRPSHPEALEDLYILRPELLGRQARFGAAANSDLRRTGRAKYRTTMKGKYQVEKEGWSIVATEHLTVQPIPGGEAEKRATYSEAVQALQKLKQADPGRAAGLKILRLSDVRESIE